MYGQLQDKQGRKNSQYDNTEVLIQTNAAGIGLPELERLEQTIRQGLGPFCTVGE